MGIREQNYTCIREQKYTGTRVLKITRIEVRLRLLHVYTCM